MDLCLGMREGRGRAPKDEGRHGTEVKMRGGGEWKGAGGREGLSIDRHEFTAGQRPAARLKPPHGAHKAAPRK